jgi:hypothetical protein
VWVPIILAAQSWRKLTRAAGVAKLDQGPKEDPAEVPHFWYKFIAVTLVLYVVLVPGVLLAARMGLSPKSDITV